MSLQSLKRQAEDVSLIDGMYIVLSKKVKFAWNMFILELFM